jgi:hypothetical protein
VKKPVNIVYGAGEKPPGLVTLVIDPAAPI